MGIMELLETSWILLVTSLTLFYYSRYAYQSRNCDRVVKSRSLILFIGYMIPSVFGIVFQVIPTLFFGTLEIPLTTATIIFFSIAALIGLKKYSLLSYNPFHATKDVLEMIEEGVVILDENLNVRYMNWGFTRLTGYEKDEMIGESIKVLDSKNNSNDSFSIESEYGNTLSGRIEIKIMSKEAYELVVYFGHSPF